MRFLDNKMRGFLVENHKHPEPHSSLVVSEKGHLNHSFLMLTRWKVHMEPEKYWFEVLRDDFLWSSCPCWIWVPKNCKGFLIRFKVFFGTMFFSHQKRPARRFFRIETEIQMCRCKTENYNGNSTQIFLKWPFWTTGRECVYIYLRIYSNISLYIYVYIYTLLHNVWYEMYIYIHMNLILCVCRVDNNIHILI